jgi:hypothetical protein
MVGENLNGNFITLHRGELSIILSTVILLISARFGGTNASAAGINDYGHICGAAANASGQFGHSIMRME